MADPNAPAASYIDQYNPKSKTASSFMADTSDKVTIGNVNYADATLNVETCQNTVWVKLSPETTAEIQKYSKDSNITQEKLRNLGQELVCNSYGLARAYKLTGQSYESYKKIAASIKLDLYKPLSVDFIVVDKPTFDQL